MLNFFSPDGQKNTTENYLWEKNYSDNETSDFVGLTSRAKYDINGVNGFKGYMEFAKQKA